MKYFSTTAKDVKIISQISSEEFITAFMRILSFLEDCWKLIICWRLEGIKGSRIYTWTNFSTKSPGCKVKTTW